MGPVAMLTASAIQICFDAMIQRIFNPIRHRDTAYSSAKPKTGWPIFKIVNGIIKNA